MLRLLLALPFVALLVACGGGGGGGSDAPPPPPAPGAVPVIVVQPESIGVDEGRPATFEVMASSSSALTYQWLRDDQHIAGANAASYRIEQAGPADKGARFSVVVGNATGTVTSAVATLTVYGAAPIITAQPQAQSVLSGGRATFSVGAAGSGELSFQWRRNQIDIAGANSPSYVTPPTVPGDTGAVFDVVVSNWVGSTASDVVTLTVTPVVLPPSVLAQPQARTANIGDTAVFQVDAEGTAPLFYQWRRNGVDIPGAVAAAYSVAPVSRLRDGDVYTVAVTNAAGTVASVSATLRVAAARPIDLVAGALGGPGFVAGSGAAARLPYAPTMIDAADNMYMGADSSSIIKVTPQGVVSLWRQPDGLGVNAYVKVLDSNGIFYGADGHSIVTVPLVGAPVPYVGQRSLTLSGYLSGDGVGTGALLGMLGLTADPLGNLYEIDWQHTVRKIEPDSTVTTIAGNPGHGGQVDDIGNAALLGYLTGVATDGAGNIYVMDMDTSNLDSTQWTSLVRKVTPAGVVTTLAGGNIGYQDGSGAAARFPAYSRIAADLAGTLYVFNGEGTIRKVTQAGVVSTFAGDFVELATRDGMLADARFTSVDSILFDSAGNMLVGDGPALRKITPGGVVTTVAGVPPQLGADDGAPLDARFRNPRALAFDREGNLLVGDTGNHTIRKIALAGPVSTLAGDAALQGAADGPALSASFDAPAAVAVDSAGNVFVADSAQHVIRKISTTGVVATFAGAAGVAGSTDGSGTAARFNKPSGLVVDAADNLYVADKGSHIIRKITPAGAVSLFAGRADDPDTYDGTGPAARFYAPAGLAIDQTGNIYVADSGNHVIRKITPAAQVTKLAGMFASAGYVDGANNAPRFNDPTAVAVDRDGNVYVADVNNRMIRKVTQAGVVSTVVGSGQDMYGLRPGVLLGNLPGSLSQPAALALKQTAAGIKLFVVDGVENSVLAIELP
jgi:sugar lactone lactonase YvrE